MCPSAVAQRSPRSVHAHCPGHPSNRWPLSALLGIAAFSLLPVPAHAQIFNVTGGASDLYGSEGLTLHTEEQGFRSTGSIGYADGLRLGGEAERELSPHTTARVGDSVVPFVLPTDIFDRSHILLRRGAGFSHQTPTTGYDLFAGGGAQNYVVPYLSYSTIDHALGMLFLHHTLTPRLEVSSYLVSLGQTTAIGSLSWHPRADLSIAASTGVGSDHPFGAVSLDLERSGLGLLASYTGQSGGFHRLSIDPSSSAEVTGANLRTWRNWKHLHLDFARQQYQSIAEFSNPATVGSIAEGGIGTTFGHFDLSARLFHTSASGLVRQQSSYSLTNSFRFTRSVATFYTGSGSPAVSPTSSTGTANAPTRSFVATEYIRAARRLELSSTVDLEGTSHSYSFGGTLTSNRLDLNIGQQMYFLPFAAGQPLQQVWVLHLRLHAFGNTSVEVENQLGSDDRVHYTAYAGDYLYREGSFWHTGDSPSFKGVRFLISGCVRTSAGEPIAGAAVTINRDEVFTGTGGCFSYAPRHAGRYQLSLTPADFMTAGRYAPLAAPQTLELTAAGNYATVALTTERLPNDAP